MAKVFTSVDSSNVTCPVCGGTLKSVTYYLASQTDVRKSVRSEALKRVTTTRTTYANVSQRTGRICISCGLKKFKRTRTLGLILMATGFVLTGVCLAISIIFWEWLNYTISRTFRDFFYLINLASLGAFVIGVILAIYSKKYVGFKKHSKYISDADNLSYLFVKNVDVTKLPTGSTALSTTYYSQLKPTARS